MEYDEIEDERRRGLRPDTAAAARARGYGVGNWHFEQPERQHPELVAYWRHCREVDQVFVAVTFYQRFQFAYVQAEAAPLRALYFSDEQLRTLRAYLLSLPVWGTLTVGPHRVRLAHVPATSAHDVALALRVLTTGQPSRAEPAPSSSDLESQLPDHTLPSARLPRWRSGGSFIRREV